MKRNELTKRLDTLVQTCARYRGAKKKRGNWVNKCVTCGKVTTVGKGIQGGHFIPRGCHATRWDKANVSPQCSGCNNYRNGAYIEYSDWMINNHNEEYNRLLELYDKHKSGRLKPFTALDLKVMHDVWLFRGRALEKSLGLKLFPAKWVYLELKEDDVDIEEAIVRY